MTAIDYGTGLVVLPQGVNKLEIGKWTVWATKSEEGAPYLVARADDSDPEDPDDEAVSGHAIFIQDLQPALDHLKTMFKPGEDIGFGRMSEALSDAVELFDLPRGRKPRL